MPASRVDGKILMHKKILLITPPFTQLNTPYPASPYLKGFLSSRGYDVFQADLGIELINRLFSRKGLQELFTQANNARGEISMNSLRIIHDQDRYLHTVDQVMAFLQYRDNTLSPLLCSDTFLPRASRFDQLPDMEWSFGSIGINDRARFLATLYVEDIGDLIKDAIAPHFGFSRYAEKLALSAHSFAPIQAALQQPENMIEAWLIELLQHHIEMQRPDVLGMTIPFPGNLYAALKCGQHVKRTAPRIKIVAGGGFVNTELRELSEPAVFDYVDFITLDDGELPFLDILDSLDVKKGGAVLKRTFVRIDDEVIFANDDQKKDPSSSEAGCPDYSDLPLESYLSLIEIANPMHRLWSDGRWNKLTVAHGCYWHRCSFCDTSLDYIRRCDTVPASVLVDRIQQVAAQTGQTGFHFVDEAAPPAALKELALELLRRKVCISWWTNIRFEKAFTKDLCRLLAASGCIAATGGLEAASDRLLQLMNKGIDIRQAALACRNFSEAGIMVHAYLMYGFPTQTSQETIDALETVRQFFNEGLIQSAFWHRFTATVHSDVGNDPAKYHCTITAPPSGRFATNDLLHEDPEGCDHGAFAKGLSKAVYNFMHGIGMDMEVNEWFDFRVPAISIRKDLAGRAIKSGPAADEELMGSRLLWIGNTPYSANGNSVVKGRPGTKDAFAIYTKTGRYTLTSNRALGEWMIDKIPMFSPQNSSLITLEYLRRDYETHFSTPFRSFLRSKEWKTLRDNGLLLI